MTFNSLDLSVYQVIYINIFIIKLILICVKLDRLCGLVVRVSGYRYRGPGFDRRRYQIF